MKSLTEKQNVGHKAEFLEIEIPLNSFYVLFLVEMECNCGSVWENVQKQLHDHWFSEHKLICYQKNGLAIRLLLSELTSDLKLCIQNLTQNVVIFFPCKAHEKANQLKKAYFGKIWALLMFFSPSSVIKVQPIFLYTYSHDYMY